MTDPAPIVVGSATTVELRAGVATSKRWMELLAAIGETRSISAAARAVHLSYKAAWDAVDAMNNLADAPLVARTKGGKGGGGTVLTARGEQLVATFRAVEAENQRFLSMMNARIGSGGGHPQQDLTILGRLTMMTSARNHFSGIVTAIKAGAVNDEVELELSGGDRIAAIVTRESAENLGLKLGSPAVALVKASWVIVVTEGGDGPRLKLSARNQLRGTVRRITPGAVNTEVVIALGGGNSVAAIITNTSAQELALAEGVPATAIFKASSVILGVSL